MKKKKKGNMLVMGACQVLTVLHPNKMIAMLTSHGWKSSLCRATFLLDHGCLCLVLVARCLAPQSTFPPVATGFLSIL